MLDTITKYIFKENEIVFIINIIQLISMMVNFLSTCTEGTAIEKLPPSDWLVDMFVAHFLIVH